MSRADEAIDRGLKRLRARLRAMSDDELVAEAVRRGILEPGLHAVDLDDEVEAEARLEAELLNETDPLMIESMIQDKRRARGGG